MTRHVFKLAWNRKRTTGLIMVEILICYLVLSGLLSAAINFVHLRGHELGFEWRDVWEVRVSGPRFYGVSDEEIQANLAQMREVAAEIRRAPEVVAAANAANLPYSGSSWQNTTWIEGRDHTVYNGATGPETLATLGYTLIHGRWLEDGDRALAYVPVVVTRNLALAHFGTADAVGQILPDFDENGEREEPEDESDIRRIVGVVQDIKRNGELDPLPYMSFHVTDPTGGSYLPGQFAVKVAPGTDAEFEDRLARALQRVAPEWSFEMQLLEDMRERRLRERIGPLIIVGVVTAFLVTMVGLGLVGVLWQSVTRRTAELGVRRALGASAASVRGQVLGELWALTSFAVVLGSAIFLQFPLVGANFGLGWPVFLAGLTAAALVIYAFVTVCGLYPTWLATRILPAAALQYE